MVLLPEQSFLRDLRLRIDGTKPVASASLPFVSEIETSLGSVRAGLLATLIDAVSGRLAMIGATPNVVATSLIAFQTLRPLVRREASGALTARGALVRQGRQALSIEVAIHDGEDSDPSVLGLATFSVIPVAPEDRARLPRLPPDGVVELGGPGAGLERPFLECIGLRIIDAAAGIVEVDFDPYVQNHLGALQGGIVATLADVASELAAQAATGEALTTLDLSVSYLALGRVGPFRTRARVLRTTRDSAVVRAEVRDIGADDRLMCIGHATTGRVSREPTS